jgi:hypothetical protein
MTKKPWWTYILGRGLDPALWAESPGVGHILLTVGHGVVAQHRNGTLRHQVATHHNIVLQLPAQQHASVDFQAFKQYM